MVPKVQFKGHMTDTCVFGIVVSKLGHCKEPSPVILLEVDKSLEISFYSAVLPLGLTVNLRVKRGK